jgi:hypothetical protein
MHVADMLMDVFAADSAVLRATASAASQMPRRLCRSTRREFL